MFYGFSSNLSWPFVTNLGKQFRVLHAMKYLKIYGKVHLKWWCNYSVENTKIDQAQS